MLISKPMPAITWSIHLAPSPAGAWSFASPPARLTDGNPRLKCRIVGADATDFLSLQAVFATPIRPRLFACVSRGPTTATPELRVLGRAVGSSEFAIDLVPEGAAPFVQTPAGPLSAFYVGSGAVEVDAVRFAVGPAQDAGDSAFLDVGQLLAAEAFEFEITRDWQEQLEDLSRHNSTLTGQVFTVQRPTVRVASVGLAPVPFSETLGGGDTLQALQASLSGRRPVLCVPLPRGVGRGGSAPIDQASVQASALFGSAVDLGTIREFSGTGLFQLGLKFRETPG